MVWYGALEWMTLESSAEQDLLATLEGDPIAYEQRTHCIDSNIDVRMCMPM